MTPILELNTQKNRELADPFRMSASNLFSEVHSLYANVSHKFERTGQQAQTLDFNADIYGAHKAETSAKAMLNEGAKQKSEAAHEHKYEVQSGDSLWKIAKHELGNGASNKDILSYVRDIAKANEFNDLKHVIKPQDVLTLPKHDGTHVPSNHPETSAARSTEQHLMSAPRVEPTTAAYKAELPTLNKTEHPSAAQNVEHPTVKAERQATTARVEQQTASPAHVEQAAVAQAPKASEFERVADTKTTPVSAANLSEQAADAFVQDVKSGKIKPETIATIRTDLEACVKAGKETAFINNFNEVVFENTTGKSYMLEKQGDKYTLTATDIATKEATTIAKFDLQHKGETTDKQQPQERAKEKVQERVEAPVSADTKSSYTADLTKAENIARQVMKGEPSYETVQDWSRLLQKTYDQGGQAAEDQLIKDLSKNLKFSGFEIKKEEAYRMDPERYTLVNSKTGQTVELGPTGKESSKRIHAEEAADEKVRVEQETQSKESARKHQVADDWQKSAVDALPQSYLKGSFGSSQDRQAFVKLFEEESKKNDDGYFTSQSSYEVLQKKLAARGLQLEMEGGAHAKCGPQVDSDIVLRIKDSHGKVLDSVKVHTAQNNGKEVAGACPA